MTTTLSPELSPENRASERATDTRISAEVHTTDETDTVDTHAQTLTDTRAHVDDHADPVAVTRDQHADPVTVTRDQHAESTVDTRDQHAQGTDVPAEPVTDTRDQHATPAVDTVDTHAQTPVDTRTRVTVTDHRAELDAIRTQAGRIRYGCDQLEAIGGTVTTDDVRGWLETHGVTTERTYTSRVVNSWKNPRGENTAGDLPVMTAAALAEIEANTGVLAPPAPAATEPEPGQDEDQDDEQSTTVRVPTPATVGTHTTTDPEDDQQSTTVRVPTPATVGTHDPETAPPIEDLDEHTAELARRVAQSRNRLAFQSDSALTEALSDAELAAERKAAERRREIRREIEALESEAELARLRKATKAEQADADDDSKDARWHRRAVAQRRRLASPDASLTQLYRESIWAGRILVAVLVLGMVWSGYNVQHNLMPSGDMTSGLYWLAYGLEALISLPLIVIMRAHTAASRRGIPVPDDRGLSLRKVIPIEATLLLLTLGLNIGPHLVAGDWGRSLEYAIAPVMVGVAVWLHGRTSDHYAYLITHEDRRAATARL